MLIGACGCESCAKALGIKREVDVKKKLPKHMRCHEDPPELFKGTYKIRDSFFLDYVVPFLLFCGLTASVVAMVYFFIDIIKGLGKLGEPGG